MCRFAFRLFPILGVFVWGAFAIKAQTRPSPSPPPPPISSSNDRQDRHADFGADPSEDLRIKLAIKTEQRQYDENLARAREASELGTQLLDKYNTTQAIDADEEKKLDRLEKLVKRIRNEAGGQNSEDEVKNAPGTLAKAIKRVADLSHELRKDVEKTPRHVISAVFINR